MTQADLSHEGTDADAQELRLQVSPNAERSTAGGRGAPARAWAALDWLEHIWRGLRDLWSLLRVVRFAVLSLVVYVVLIVGDQGVDSLLTFLDRPLWQWLLINYFALQTWQWSRLMVTYRYLPLDRRDIDESSVKKMALDSKQRLHELELSYEGSPAKAREDGVDLVRLRAADTNLAAKVALICAQNARRQSPQATERLQCWMEWLPRVMGAAVYAVAAVALALAARRYGGLREGQTWQLWLFALLMLLNGAVFMLFVWQRRTLFNGVVLAWLRPDWLSDEIRSKHPLPASDGSPRARLSADALKQLSPEARVGWRLVVRKGRLADPDTAFTPGARRKRFALAFSTDSNQDLRASWRWHSLRDVPYDTRAWLGAWALITSIAFLGTALAPHWFARFGPAGNVAIALSFWTMLGTALVWLFDHRRVPLVVPVFAWGIFTNLIFDNHTVRIQSGPAPASARAATPSAARPDIGTFLQAQLEQRQHPPRPVIVATSGGGIRAAYWTATVLAQLDAQVGEPFRHNLLAVSAVSGGGLGAAAYLAAVQAVPGREDLRARLDTFLAHDFLAPTAGALLGRDLMYRLLPLYPFEDRAAVLERAWEQAWDDAFAGNGAFSRGYLALEGSPGSAPALLVNGTLAATGERIITSPFTITRTAFREARDFFKYNGERDIPLSTAVSNGARFPIVSPAGTLRDRDDTVVGQIVDGGYFENFGADTALDVLRALCETQPSASRACGTTEGLMRPIVIQISSDPALPTSDKEARPPCSEVHPPNAEALPPAASRITQVAVPLVTFFNTRDARGESAMCELESLTTERYAGTFVHLRLVQYPDREAPPLGWVLSAAARDTIASNLTAPANAGNIDRVVAALGAR